MLIFLVRRLLAATVLIWALSLLVFLILNLIPGDPAQIYLGVRSDPELLEKFRVEHRLDQPLYVRYFDWVGGLFEDLWAARLPRGKRSATSWSEGSLSPSS